MPIVTPLEACDMTAPKPDTCQDITVILSSLLDPDMGLEPCLELGVRQGEQVEEVGEMRDIIYEIIEDDSQVTPPLINKDKFLDNLIEVVDCKAEIKDEEINEPKNIKSHNVSTGYQKLGYVHNCSKCGEQFSDSKGVKRHMRHHNRNLGFNCKALNCNASYAAAQFVERHILKAHKENLERTCNIKNPGLFEYKFITNGKLNQQNKTHEGPTPRIFKCPHCNVNYVTKGELNMHKVVHEGQKNGTLKCPHCNVKYVKNNALQVHINVNKLTKVIQCGVGQCNVRFMAKCEGKRHMRKEHGVQINEAPKPNLNTRVLEQFKEQDKHDLPPQQQSEGVANKQSAQQQQRQQQQQPQQQLQQQLEQQKRKTYAQKIKELQKPLPGQSISSNFSSLVGHVQIQDTGKVRKASIFLNHDNKVRKMRRILPKPVSPPLQEGQVIIPVTVKTPCTNCGKIIVASGKSDIEKHVCLLGVLTASASKENLEELPGKQDRGQANNVKENETPKQTEICEMSDTTEFNLHNAKPVAFNDSPPESGLGLSCLVGNNLMDVYFEEYESPAMQLNMASNNFKHISPEKDQNDAQNLSLASTPELANYNSPKPNNSLVASKVSLNKKGNKILDIESARKIAKVIEDKIDAKKKAKLSLGEYKVPKILDIGNIRQVASLIEEMET